jgi:pimeloyl-ACP methyl ester carboxylesterase
MKFLRVKKRRVKIMKNNFFKKVAVLSLMQTLSFSLFSWGDSDMLWGKPKEAKNTHVILLHGILRSDSHMRWMEKAFKRKGYIVSNIDYPSTKMTIEELSEKFLRPVVDKSEAEKIILIGYSMGGLLIRSYLAGDVDSRVEKVLMLGTPNGGSEITDFLKDTPVLDALYEKGFGIAGQQLGTLDGVAKNWKLPENITYGVIAGTLTVDPVSSLFILPGPNDGKVTVENTKLPVKHQHKTLPVSHMLMPQARKVIKASLRFAHRGYF